jgi:hypothetical protein
MGTFVNIVPWEKSPLTRRFAPPSPAGGEGCIVHQASVLLPFLANRVANRGRRLPPEALSPRGRGRAPSGDRVRGLFSHDGRLA